MKRALLIAEKPSLMRDIQTVYLAHRSEIPYTIDFMAQRGHLLTLMLPDELDEKMKVHSWDNLPFFPEEHGVPVYDELIFVTRDALAAPGGYEAITHGIPYNRKISDPMDIAAAAAQVAPPV